MDYTIEYPEQNMAVLTLTVDKDAWQKELAEAAQKTGSDDASTNREFAISTFAGQALQEAVQKNGLKLATQPSLTAVDNEDGSVSISVNMTLVPEVKLGQYTGFNLLKQEVTVSEEEVLQDVAQRISSSKIWSKVPDGTPAKEGDQVVIDFVGEKDGVPFPGGSADNYPLVLGSGAFIPGFEEQLINTYSGETKDVSVTFPEDYFEPSLAGAAVIFKVTVKAVEEEVKPELTDTFIEKMKLDGVKTVEQLKEKARADMIAVKEQEAENRQAMEILNLAAQNSTVDIPQAMIDSQVQQYMSQYEENLKQYGMSFEDYLKASGQNAQDFQSRLVPQVTEELKSALVLEAIAEKEEIKASQEELEEEYKLLSSIYNFPSEQLKMLIPQAAVEQQIVQNKTLDFLKKNN